MKNGHKHKTGAFGTSAERYISRLLMLIKHSDKHRRPDLMSPVNSYNPALVLEVKSGVGRKGTMVDYQLHYAIRTKEAYSELFGEDPPARRIQTQLFEEPIVEKGRFENSEPVAYYYCVVDRVDGLRSWDIDRAYATIKCEFGDIFLVPHEFGFYSFVAAKVKRTGNRPETVIHELREMMKKHARSWNTSGFVNRELNKNSWQDIHGRDILSVFENDPSITSSQGRERIRIISDNYTGFASLQRARIPGPNDTSIYALVQPEDYDLFNNQAKRIVESRVPIIERVSRARKRAVPLLDRIVPIVETEETEIMSFENYDVKAREEARKMLKFSEAARLERLANWLDVGEKELRVSDPF